MIVPDQGEKPDVPIHAPLHRSNAETFASLYEGVKDTKDKDKKTILKADRSKRPPTPCYCLRGRSSS